MTKEHQNYCPECGAPQIDGLPCWEQFGAILAWEWQDPELQAQHFLTVASYNLQHPAQFVDQVLDGLRVGLIDYLDHGMSAEQLRRRAAQAFEGSTRVLKREAERRPVLRHWPMTIADVYIPDQPAGAAERVKAWATSIRAELSPPSKE